MKFLLAVCWVSGSHLCAAHAQQAEPPAADRESPPSGPQAPAERPRSRDHAAFEQQFQRTLSDAVLVGHWQVTTDAGPTGTPRLSEPRPEQYTIESVTKADGDYWIFRARIEFGGTDVTLPLRLRVVWAEDTPVITLDQLAIPGVGTYSARVMIFRDFYSGTWFGEGNGGVLAGQIVPRGIWERLQREQGAAGAARPREAHDEPHTDAGSEMTDEPE